MKETLEKLEGLTDQVKEHIHTKIELARLQLIEKTSFIVSDLIAILLVTLCSLFFLLFGSIAGAWALSKWIGKPYSGFLIVAGFYLLMAILVWVARHKVIRFPVVNAVIKMLNKRDDDNE